MTLCVMKTEKKNPNNFVYFTFIDGWKYPEVCEDLLIRIMLMSFHSFKQFELYEHKPS